MGKPKFSRKKYDTPRHPWKESQIKDENELIKKYGLKNKKEIWKSETKLRLYRSQARELLASITTGDKQSKKESEQLLEHLSRMNILPPNSTLDDVLALDTESILSRRLQTVSYLKGFAGTPKQARQLISHGHIEIDGRRVTIPGYMVTKNEENKIGYTADSALNDSMHPARPKSDFVGLSRKKSSKPKEEKPEEPEKGKPKTDEKEESKKQSETKGTEKQKPDEEKEKQTDEKVEETKEQEKPEEQKTEGESKPEQKIEEKEPRKEEKPEETKEEPATKGTEKEPKKIKEEKNVDKEQENKEKKEDKN